MEPKNNNSKEMIKLALVKLSEDMNEPLNLLELASYLKKKIPSIKIKIIDMAYDNIMNDLLRFKPNLVGISAMTVEYPLSIQLCKKIKEKTDVPVVIGGIHISCLPKSLDMCFDLGIVGEAEIPFYEVINNYSKNKIIDYSSIRQVSGIVFYDKEKLVINPQKNILLDLDEIPVPDRALLDKNYFLFRPMYMIGRYRRWNSIITARGCPYNCKFCISTRFFSKLRFRSARRVVDEIKDLYINYKIEHINIWDDLFCASVPRLKDIVNLLEEEKLLGKITFNTNIRGNIATDEIFDLYKKMGVKSIGLGFESGSDRILRYLKGKTITVEQNFNALKKGIKKGFNMSASFMIGVPGEKIEDMEKTRDVIKKCIDIGVKRIFFFVLTPFPGCDIWEIAKQRMKVQENMDFSKLSFHEDLPLLLDEDVPITEYMRVRKQIIYELKRIKHNCVKEYFIDNPLLTIKSIVLHPINSIMKVCNIKNEKENVEDI